MPARPGRFAVPNPFYVLLLVVSTVFVVTALGYLIGPFAAQRAIDRPDATRPGLGALNDWFERRGPTALGVEIAVMIVVGLLAMATDRLFGAGPRRDGRGGADGP